ncbi:SDR family NAD(P)-dependent oxidoreductase [Parasphingopyxis algicola]|uniref:oxidoreductase n=1 Tax=Parasphingopyxis algicola TaxID=2026624 RepID=UPI0015A15395|nr:oxidoreductase [Parasphingopyxis algicola]QLC25603.1 SDR family NAD(P)-dependent oxidoreductase [Parasphingopyxis algicola]
MPKIADSGITNWTPDRLPDLAGKTYLVTGGNSGIGFEASRMLGEAGGDIVIACRDPAKAEKAVAELKQSVKGKVETVALDLADLSSVRTAAEEIHTRYDTLDALVNNAGIMQTPETRTVDGFELQLGTNHLGHFLLAGLLFDLVEKAEGRIVIVSSIAHKYGIIYRDDLMLEKSYSPTSAYTQSKLANLMFAIELDRRLRAKNLPVKAIACHPGYSNTALQSTGPAGLLNVLYTFLNPIMAQPAGKGAIPTVLAAAGTEAQSGAYYGPTGWGDARGPVGDAFVARRALNEETAAWLWEASEKLTGFEWTKLD